MAKTAKTAKTANQAPAGFKKGQKVKVTINTATGVTTGSGKVVELPPLGASRGAFRLTVKTDDGRTLRPYPSQCTAA